MELEPVLEFDILKSIGLGDAPEDQKVKALDNATAFVLGKVADRIKERLDTATQQEFRKLFWEHTSTEKERMEFLASRVPDFEDIVLEETFRLKLELMEPASAA